MASMSKNGLAPKSSIPAIPYINGMHLVNVPVANIGSSSTRKMSLQPLHAANYKHLNTRVKNKENQWRVWCHSVGFSSGYPTSADTICLVSKFIDGIGSENKDTLIQFLSHDWELHDDVFNGPSGTKNAKEFLEKAKKAIQADIPAKNEIGTDSPRKIILKIKTISTSDDLTAKVQWHLVWKGRKEKKSDKEEEIGRKKKEGEKEEEEEEEIEIPFTSSCHVFECVKEDQNLKIRKITKVRDPDKSILLDQSILELVEAAVSYFHNFPENAKGMLSSIAFMLSRMEAYIALPPELRI